MSTSAQIIQKAIDNITPDLKIVKTRMKATWEDGDYAGFATYMEPGAVEILKAWKIPSDSRLLDIGCGSGQTAIPAARMGFDVTGIDIATNLIEHATERANYEDLNACFDVGDAADLPYPDASFDAVISLIGAMFAPDYDSVADELARVCTSGGRLHMANWTPEGFAATMFRCVSKYAPPPAGIASPALWGVEDIVYERLSDNFTDFELHRQYYPLWRYPFDSKTLVEFFKLNFGPVKLAFESIDTEKQASFRAELEDIFEAHNVADDGNTEIKGQYLNISARRK